MHRTPKTAFAAAVSVLACAALAAACDSPTHPREPAGITVLSGAAVTDSVSAPLAQPLVVEVRDSSGHLLPGVSVRFAASTVSAPGGVQVPSLALASVGGTEYQQVSAATTDNIGRAAVMVQMGTVAGTATVDISVPTLGFSGTATYTVTAGRAFRVTAAPLDSAVYVGGSYSLRVSASDRYGNAAAAPALGAGDSPAATASGTTVTGRAVGRVHFPVTAGGVTTTVSVSVVPQGTLLASGVDGVYVFGMDGSGLRRVLAASFVQGPRWLPNGQKFVYSTDRSHALVSDLNGNASPLVPGGGLSWELWAHPSRDGQWIYFGGYDASYRGYPYRVHPDGTGLSLIPRFTPDDFNQSYPSASPDGTRVAYFREVGDSRNVVVRVLDLRTGTTVGPDVAGHSPEWSHGETIAFLDLKGGEAGPVKLMNPDGTNQRYAGPATRSWYFGIDWSPDDKYIAAYGADSNRIELINVATGETIPLPFSAGLREPAWKP